MKIDQRYSLKAVRRFANELDKVPKHLRDELHAMFNRDQSDEFYAGLLAGLAGAEVLARRGLGHYLSLMIGAVSEELVRKEIV